MWLRGSVLGFERVCVTGIIYAHCVRGYILIHFLFCRNHHDDDDVNYDYDYINLIG